MFSPVYLDHPAVNDEGIGMPGVGFDQTGGGMIGRYRQNRGIQIENSRDIPVCLFDDADLPFEIAILPVRICLFDQASDGENV